MEAQRVVLNQAPQATPKFYVDIVERGTGTVVLTTLPHGFGENVSPTSRSLKRQEKTEIRTLLKQARESL